MSPISQLAKSGKPLHPGGGGVATMMRVSSQQEITQMRHVWHTNQTAAVDHNQLGTYLLSQNIFQ